MSDAELLLDQGNPIDPVGTLPMNAVPVGNTLGAAGIPGVLAAGIIELPSNPSAASATVTDNTVAPLPEALGGHWPPGSRWAAFLSLWPGKAHHFEVADPPLVHDGGVVLLRARHYKAGGYEDPPGLIALSTIQFMQPWDAMLQPSQFRTQTADAYIVRR